MYLTSLSVLLHAVLAANELAKFWPKLIASPPTILLHLCTSANSADPLTRKVKYPNHATVIFRSFSCFCFVLIIPTSFLFLHLQEPEDDSQSRVLSSGLARGPGSNLLFFCHAILFCLTNVKLTVYFSMQWLQQSKSHLPFFFLFLSSAHLQTTSVHFSIVSLLWRQRKHALCKVHLIV